LGIQGVQQKLKRREPLLTINNGPLLHQSRWSLNLLQHNGSEEVRVMLVVWSSQSSVGDTNDVIPKRFPLVLLVPHVGSLKERDNQPLRLHKDHLGRTDLGLH